MHMIAHLALAPLIFLASFVPTCLVLPTPLLAGYGMVRAGHAPPVQGAFRGGVLAAHLVMRGIYCLLPYLQGMAW